MDGVAILRGYSADIFPSQINSVAAAQSEKLVCNCRMAPMTFTVGELDGVSQYLSLLADVAAFTKHVD